MYEYPLPALEAKKTKNPLPINNRDYCEYPLPDVIDKTFFLVLPVGNNALSIVKLDRLPVRWSLYGGFKWVLLEKIPVP